MLLDCDTHGAGCNGGLMDSAFDFIKSNGGLCTAEDYVFTGNFQKCHSSTCSVVADSTIKGYVDLSPEPLQQPATSAALEAAVAQQPVSAAIQASNTFQFYKHGVITSNCPSDEVDSAILVVGYGSIDGTDYWKVKNSW